MSKVYFCSDFHWGHKNIHKFRTKFSSPEENDEFFKDLWLSTVTKRDQVIMLGDMVFTYDAMELLDSLPGRKKLVLGNHDCQNVSMVDKMRWLGSGSIADVYGIHSKNNTWWTHAPVHPAELRSRVNIHGHTHGNMPRYDGFDEFYLSVCPEDTGYKMLEWNEDIKPWVIQQLPKLVEMEEKKFGRSRRTNRKVN